MFITKKQLPRRTFLQGTGVTLALPLLESMVPAATALAQTPANPKPRFVGEGRGTSRKTPVHYRDTRKGKRSNGGRYRTVVPISRTAGGHNGLGSLGGRSLPHRDQAEKDGGLRRERRQPDNRSGHRPKNRSGQSVAVIATRRRRSQL